MWNEPVGLLGIGTMGRGMALTMAGHGLHVQAWNRSATAVDEVCHASSKLPGTVTAAATPAEAARGVAAVMTCVSNDEALEAVSFGPDGIEAVLGAGQVWIDCGTTGLELTGRLAALATERGAEFLDAPITGSMLGAREGNLTFMVGGAAAALAKVRPLLDILGKHAVHAGARVGDGQRIKYCLNMTQSVVLQGVLEGYALARSLGLEVSTLFEVFEHSAGKTGVGSFKTGYLQRRDFTPHFKLGLMHKDLGLALGSAEAMGARLPLSERVLEVYGKAVEAGLADEDFLATVKLLEDQISLPLTVLESTQSNEGG